MLLFYAAYNINKKRWSHQLFLKKNTIQPNNTTRPTFDVPHEVDYELKEKTVYSQLEQSRMANISQMLRK